ncbi:hypothetical protein BH11ARM1_BH11ARM1_15530 [soil metagenome]
MSQYSNIGFNSAFECVENDYGISVKIKLINWAFRLKTQPF